MDMSAPDDWQAHIAQGQQEQMARRAAQIGKQGRRSNRRVGGCVMLLGLLVMLAGVGFGVNAIIGGGVRDVLDSLEGLGTLLGGGAVIVAAGWAVWRGQRS